MFAGPHCQISKTLADALMGMCCTHFGVVHVTLTEHASCDVLDIVKKVTYQYSTLHGKPSPRRAPTAMHAAVSCCSKYLLLSQQSKCA